MNICDYDFDEARKPCGMDESGGVKTSGKCIKDAKTHCRWFPMCDLGCKNPPEAPIKPKTFTKPLRGLYARIFVPKSQFFAKQDKIKRTKK